MSRCVPPLVVHKYERGCCRNMHIRTNPLIWSHYQPLPLLGVEEYWLVAEHNNNGRATAFRWIQPLFSTTGQQPTTLNWERIGKSATKPFIAVKTMPFISGWRLFCFFTHGGENLSQEIRNACVSLIHVPSTNPIQLKYNYPYCHTWPVLGYFLYVFFLLFNKKYFKKYGKN